MWAGGKLWHANAPCAPLGGTWQPFSTTRPPDKHAEGGHTTRKPIQLQRLGEFSGRRYAAEVIPGVIRRRAVDRIEWHQRQGDLVVVVSASLDAYLRPWCEAAGVELICTELEGRGGRLTGRYRHGDCSGAEKLRRILERHEPGRYPLVYAYGDTSEDREMLALAHRKYYRWKEIGEWSDAVAVRE